MATLEGLKRNIFEPNCSIKKKMPSINVDAIEVYECEAAGAVLQTIPIFFVN